MDKNKLNQYPQLLDQETLVEQYAPLVHKIASQVSLRLPNHIARDDLIQNGMIGLLTAAKQYDPSQGASFETYARIRIRGTILDEVRKDNWVSRNVHKNMRDLLDTIKQLEQAQQYNVDDKDIAKMMGVSLKDYHSMLQDIQANQLIGYDDSDFLTQPIDHEWMTPVPTPQDELQKSNFIDTLMRILKSLPIRECVILSLYYDEEMNFKEIAETLNLTESRVSQLHSQAMMRVKARMESEH